MTNSRRTFLAHFQRVAMHRAQAGQPLFRMTDRDLQRVSADTAALPDSTRELAGCGVSAAR